MFPYAAEWKKLYTSLVSGSMDARNDWDDLDSCDLGTLGATSFMLEQADLNTVNWLHWASVENPWQSDVFLWLDSRRCAHLLSAPMDLRHLTAATHENRVLAFVAEDLSQMRCFGSMIPGKEIGMRVHAKVWGGTQSSLGILMDQYLKTARDVLDQGHVLSHAWQVLSLMYPHAHELFYTVSSDSNIQRLDIADATCWATRILSSTSPSFEIHWPPHGSSIAPEEAILLLEFKRVIVSKSGPDVPEAGQLEMWNEQRYVLPSDTSDGQTTSKVQICVNVTILTAGCTNAHFQQQQETENERGDSNTEEKKTQGLEERYLRQTDARDGIARTGREERSTASIGGQERNSICTVSYQCGDSDSLWLGELAQGTYSLEVELETVNGLAITSSQKITFDIARVNEWREAPEVQLRAFSYLVQYILSEIERRFEPYLQESFLCTDAAMETSNIASVFVPSSALVIVSL